MDGWMRNDARVGTVHLGMSLHQKRSRQKGSYGKQLPIITPQILVTHVRNLLFHSIRQLRAPHDRDGAHVVRDPGWGRGFSVIMGDGTRRRLQLVGMPADSPKGVFIRARDCEGRKKGMGVETVQNRQPVRQAVCGMYQLV